MKLKLYVGCGLIYAPEEFRKQVDDLKNSLRKKYEILDFLGTVAGTAKEVYQHDIQTCIATCDAFVAICDYPSLGLGYELGFAVENLHTPTLALAHKDSKVTRLVQGIDQPNYRFERYENIKEVPKRIDTFLAMLSKQR